MNLLVDFWLVLTQNAGFTIDNEVTVSIQFQIFGSLKVQNDRSGIGARVDNQIVLESRLRPVIGNIDSGVYADVLHSGVCGDVSAPSAWIIPNQIIDRSRQRI